MPFLPTAGVASLVWGWCQGNVVLVFGLIDRLRWWHCLGAEQRQCVDRLRGLHGFVILNEKERFRCHTVSWCCWGPLNRFYGRWGGQQATYSESGQRSRWACDKAHGDSVEAGPSTCIAWRTSLHALSVVFAVVFALLGTFYCEVYSAVFR